jgi:hypothetical protein
LLEMLQAGGLIPLLRTGSRFFSLNGPSHNDSVK